MTAGVSVTVQSVLAFGDGAASDVSLSGYQPPDPERFGVSLQVFLSTSATEPPDSFDVLVCTPQWMADQVEAGSWDRFRYGGLRVIPQEVAVGAGIWFMRRWDATTVLAAIESICSAASPGPDWGMVATRVGRVMPWEFAYKYDEHVDGHYGEEFPPPR